MTPRELAKQIPGARRTMRAMRASFRAVRARVAPNQAERYDQETFAVIARVLQPTSVAIDVGAHEGVILSRICRHAPRARHHAIEPLPDFAERLRARFPSCVVHECAVAEEKGSAEFHVANRAAYSSLENRSVAQLRSYGLPNPQLRTIHVQVSTLDELIPPDVPVALIKIDVEGSEYRTLRGARSLLARCRPVVVFEAGFHDAARTRQLYELFASVGLSLTTMRRWLSGRPDFATFDEYLQTAPAEFYWLAH